MQYIKYINGIPYDMTPQEIADKQASDAAYNNRVISPPLVDQTVQLTQLLISKGVITTKDATTALANTPIAATITNIIGP